MAIEAVSATVPIKAGERLAGLNHVAELRARYWGDSWKEVERFVDDMRDKRDPQFEENNRALAAIFFLAKGNLINFNLVSFVLKMFIVPGPVKS